MINNIIHCEYSNTLRTNLNQLIAFNYNGQWVLQIDSSIDYDTAIKLFKRWFQLYTCVDVKVLAKALNDALNRKLAVNIDGKRISLYLKDGKINTKRIRKVLILEDCDKLSIFHDVIVNTLKIWINNRPMITKNLI